MNIDQLSLSGMQGLNSTIYLVQNDQNYSTGRMVSRLHRYVTRTLKVVRQQEGSAEKNYTAAHYSLAMTFSWSLALANRMHIDLESELWKRFPGICPYCARRPCICRIKDIDTSSLALMEQFERPRTFQGIQMMFDAIYPRNTLRDSVEHLAEEVGELDEAVEHFIGTHQPDLFKEIVIELVDVVANTCAVAACVRDDIASRMKILFENGCPKCLKSPCRCGFTIAKANSVCVTW